MIELLILFVLGFSCVAFSAILFALFVYIVIQWFK